MSPMRCDVEISTRPVESVKSEIPLTETYGRHVLAISSIKGLKHPRIAVVGCGYWGSKHVRVLSSMPDVGSVVVVETNRSAGEKILTAFPMVQVYSDLISALPHIDAAIIATPPRSHADLANQCL